MRRIAEDLGLAIATCQPFRDFEGLPPAKRLRALDRAERKFDLLRQELGSSLMFVCSSVAPDADAGIGRIAEDFRELGDRAARRGMRVAYEALSFGAGSTTTATPGKWCAGRTTPPSAWRSKLPHPGPRA